jgi:hypothetical protein
MKKPPAQPLYWVVKREHANHYYNASSGLFVKTRREATWFSGEWPARDVRDMLRAKVSHYRIFVSAVYAPGALETGGTDR